MGSNGTREFCHVAMDQEFECDGERFQRIPKKNGKNAVNVKTGEEKAFHMWDMVKTIHQQKEKKTKSKIKFKIKKDNIFHGFTILIDKIQFVKEKAIVYFIMYNKEKYVSDGHYEVDGVKFISSLMDIVQENIDFESVEYVGRKTHNPD